MNSEIVITKENYKDVMSNIQIELTSLFDYFDCVKDINCYDTQEVIDFQDWLNKLSIKYK